VIAIEPKQSAEGHARPKECAPTKKTKAQFGGLFGGLFLPPEYDNFL
jgi:hypothetical protein